MILSPRLLREMNFCYYGPGRVADGRFFLLVQNDDRFQAATTNALCVSHTKRAREPGHDLVVELTHHMHDEYAYVGYNYALFFLLYTRQRSVLDWDALDVPRRQPTLHREVCTSLTSKLPLPLTYQQETIDEYRRVAHDLRAFAQSTALPQDTTQGITRIGRVLESVTQMLVNYYNSPNKAVFDGVDLFFESTKRFRAWESVVTSVSVAP